MNWADFNLLLFIIAFAVGCMTLCLAVLFHLRTSYEWTKYYLVFQVSITFLLVFYSSGRYISAAFETPAIVGQIFLWLLLLDMAFMTYFIPYFSTWIIAHPWRNPYKTIFTLLSIVFVGLAITGSIIGFNAPIRISMMCIFLGDFLFCLGVLLKNIGNIKDQDARLISLACIALSLFMVPFIAADLLFSFGYIATMPIYYFWLSLIIFVYLFNYFRTIPVKPKAELDLESLGEYHVTHREEEIIKLISSGYSSKEIAAWLHISVSTVNNHIAHIYQKTHVSSRIDLLNLLRG
ncbi:MAG: response regulator transcription factor [Spirochaetota bacterium]